MPDASTPPAEPSRPERRDYVSIFLLSCSVMVFQIALTRVLSAVVWYHFAFLTISMVMLGLGAPGVWFALMRRPQRWLPFTLIASGVTVPLAVVLVVRNGTALLWAGSTIVIILCVLPAMLALGSVICLLLMKATGEGIQRMYGVDLIGACLGAVVIIPLLHLVPTPHLAAGCGLLPLLAAMLYGAVWRAIGLLLAAGLVAVFAATSWLQVTHSKGHDQQLQVPLFEKWTPTARLTVFERPFFFVGHEAGFGWGLGSKLPKDNKGVVQYWLEQDGSAGTPITKFDGDLGALAHLDYDVTSVGYQLRPPRRVAIIGGGGGRDILSALRAGATDIDAIELNRHTIAVVSETFGHISGDIYHRPGVRAVANEGRSHLTHSTDHYDFIQISLIDSWAASTAGAFALAENNLYTLEAYRLYFVRLTERGVLATSRWSGELPRLLLLTRAALVAAGVTQPERHVVLVGAGGVGTVLVAKTPFTGDDIARLRQISDERGFVIHYPPQAGNAGDFVLYPPQPGNAPYPDLLAVVEGRNEVLAARGIVVTPPTDDSPYFFHVVSPFKPGLMDENALQQTAISLNLGAMIVLRQAMVFVSLLALALFLLPFAFSALGRRAAGHPPVAWGMLLRSSLFFAAIGAAFMLLENMLVQHFVLYLGHPSYATTVIIAALLLGMGVGAMNANVLGVAGLVRRGWIVPLAIVGVVSALPVVFTATLGLALAARIAIACAILVPLGVALGTFFPLGMLHFGDANKPWNWAINGVFGVVASVMSLALSMEFGFTFVGGLSAAIYLGAWLCLALGRRAAAATQLGAVVSNAGKALIG
ncbi:MAG TPA: hypothetical protein VFD82_01075 [Planctomycetota bacterium]|nr:hypothetical protein [Planctomycetota bacterium]